MVVEGHILEVSNASGHYRPPQKLNTQLFKELEERGIDKEILDKIVRSGYTKNIGDGGVEDSLLSNSHKYFDDNQ